MMKSLFQKGGGPANQDNTGGAVSHVNDSNFAAAALLPPPKHGKSVTIADFDILKPISRYVRVASLLFLLSLPLFFLFFSISFIFSSFSSAKERVANTMIEGHLEEFI